MSIENGWETLDVEALLQRREEDAGASGATTSGNVGAFAVPLGAPLRRTFPIGLPGYTQVAHPYMPDNESNDGSDMDMVWARRMTK